jgi:hypothetical protein
MPFGFFARPSRATIEVSPPQGRRAPRKTRKRRKATSNKQEQALPREPLPPIVEIDSQESTKQHTLGSGESASPSFESVFTQGHTSFCSFLSMEDPLVMRVNSGQETKSSVAVSPMPLPESIYVTKEDRQGPVEL